MSQCTEGFHCGGKLDLETGEGLRKVGGVRGGAGRYF
jgi:hypothetical protein